MGKKVHQQYRSYLKEVKVNHTYPELIRNVSLVALFVLRIKNYHAF